MMYVFVLHFMRNKYIMQKGVTSLSLQELQWMLKTWNTVYFWWLVPGKASGPIKLHIKIPC